MADSAAYKYESDNGTTYQVVLPSDVAAALSYTPADGGEIYLPSFVSPRFVNYLNPLTRQVLAAIVTSRAIFAAPPNTVTVAGTVYELQGQFGEHRTPTPLGQVIAVAGPQGAPGTPGGTTPAYVEVLTTPGSYSVDSANGQRQILVVNLPLYSDALDITLTDSTVEPNIDVTMVCFNGRPSFSASGSDAIWNYSVFGYTDAVRVIPVPAIPAQFLFTSDNGDIHGRPEMDGTGTLVSYLNNFWGLRSMGYQPASDAYATGCLLFVDGTDGDKLKVKFGNGTIVTLATP